ncbi:uncharacterized protein LOC114338711 isoform X6 [Diabrotica virgifera virgifera]|uniref:Uncharacterized protein LOC114338711 isoform X3 n=1 Tax=Diabrotica virgifera virgifera TaxID=50390 RepID=A0A6P7G7M1_DIAVI|nr:uncharacterized protein LOC114338711 isoform X6 [Diabrotica virgifera virgifera]XP_050498855.1 uncharacterized protein LOC114338711 isoform X6 [Diabrotica virgifera virgifera]
MEVKQEQNNFLDEDCKIKIENINLSHDGLYHSVKLEVKDELSPADSPNTNTINYCGDGYSSDKLKVETIVKDIKLEETEAEPQQTENDHELEQHGHKVLHLPPYHQELNPIEKIWALVKGRVASHNTTLSINNVENITRKKFQQCR